jgi:hypothetical protein
MFDQLIVAANDLRERLLRTKGYDAVEVQYNVKVTDYKSRYQCWLELSDEFQPYEASKKVDVGSFYLGGDTPEELEDEVNEKIKKLRGRAQRELVFMMNSITTAVEHRELLATAAGRDFATALLEERNKFIHLIEAPSAE